MVRGGTAGSGGRRQIAAWLVACALLMRMLVPAGWMPSTERGFAIMMCSSAGAAPVWVSLDEHAPKPQRHDQPCTFAAFAVAIVVPADSGPLPLPALASTAVFALPIAGLAIGRGLAAPPPPPTGPPAIA